MAPPSPLLELVSVSKTYPGVKALDRVSLHRSARSAMLERPSLLAELSRLEVPVLAIAGGDDRLWPPARARAEVATIPEARFEVIPGTAHLSAFEAPELVNPILIDFLERTHAPRASTTSGETA